MRAARNSICGAPGQSPKFTSGDTSICTGTGTYTTVPAPQELMLTEYAGSGSETGHCMDLGCRYG
jgi:hypothetical protein